MRFLHRHGGQRFVRNFARETKRVRPAKTEGDEALRGGKFSVTGKERKEGWRGECIASAKINLGLSLLALLSVLKVGRDGRTGSAFWMIQFPV